VYTGEPASTSTRAAVADGLADVTADGSVSSDIDADLLQWTAANACKKYQWKLITISVFVLL